MVDVVIVTSPVTTALVAQSREELDTVKAVPVVVKVKAEVPVWMALVIVKGPLVNPEVVKDLLAAKVELAAPFPKVIPPLGVALAEEQLSVALPLKVLVPEKPIFTTAPPVDVFVNVTSFMNESPVELAKRIRAVLVELLLIAIEPEALPKVLPPVQSLWLLLNAFFVIEILPETVARLFAFVRVIF